MALVENDSHACRTLRHNRPGWSVLEQDLRLFSGYPYQGVDLFAGGLPCPPFSIAGKQLGADDERDLFPFALKIIEEAQPRAVMIENVKTLGAKRFGEYRESVQDRLRKMGFQSDWRVLHANDFGVPQLRPRFVLVALFEAAWDGFDWPDPTGGAPTVGEALGGMMGASGWPGAESWAKKADRIAPTLVGGSKKHGGPDLGPTRAKKAWAELGVNGHTLADAPPDRTLHKDDLPRLTVEMAARIQGFPDDWVITGRKTNAYRQVGNAFPPPVAEAVATRVHAALKAHDDLERRSDREVA